MTPDAPHPALRATLSPLARERVVFYAMVLRQ